VINALVIELIRLLERIAADPVGGGAVAEKTRRYATVTVPVLHAVRLKPDRALGACHARRGEMIGA
jgi:hypothetical protein